MPSDAPAQRMISSQLAGCPSLSEIYAATCLLIASIPAESLYEPRELPLHPARTVLALDFASSGMSGLSNNEGLRHNETTCKKKQI